MEIPVEAFIRDQIDSVPHLEALLLLWKSRPQHWTVEELAQRLYVRPEVVKVLLQDLTRRNLASYEAGPPEGYFYQSGSEKQDELIASVEAAYRHEIVRVSSMIHAKASSSVREFARAFRLTKEGE